MLAVILFAPTAVAGVGDGGWVYGASLAFMFLCPCGLLAVLVFLLAVSFAALTIRAERRPGEKVRDRT
jgi:hypothetical protein